MTQASGAWGSRAQLATDGFQPRDAWNPPDPSGRGAAPHSVPFGSTMARQNIGMTGNEYVGVLKEFFGEPPKPYGNMPYPLENYDLPDAYVAKNPYMRKIIQRQIQADELYAVADCLPWQLNNGSLVVMWEQWRFHDHGLDAEPHEGVPRLITSDKEAFSASLTRYGLAFVMEHGFMNTPDGVANYAANIQTIANAVKETCAHMAMEALMSCRPYEDAWAASQTSDMLPAQLEELFRNEIKMFAIAQKTEWGVEIAIGKLKERMTKRGVTNANYFIVPEGMMRTASMRPERKYNFLSGDKGGPHTPKVDGLVIRESRAYLTGRGRMPEDPCFTNVSIGEFFTMGYAHWQPSRKRNAAALQPYSTDMMNTVIYSEDTDDMVEIDFKTAVSNCGLWDENWDATALGRHFFATLQAADGDGRVLGPFNTWGDWLAEFDASNVVIDALHAKLGAAGVNVRAHLEAFLPPSVTRGSVDEHKDAALAAAAGVQASRRLLHRAARLDEAGHELKEEAELKDVQVAAIERVAKGYVEKSITREARAKVAALGPRFTDFLGPLRPAFETYVASQVTLVDFEEAKAVAIVNQHTGQHAHEVTAVRTLDAANVHVFLANAFLVLAALDLRWTTLAEAAAPRKPNPRRYVEETRAKIESMRSMYLHTQTYHHNAVRAATAAPAAQWPANEAAVGALTLLGLEQLYQVLNAEMANIARLSMPNNDDHIINAAGDYAGTPAKLRLLLHRTPTNNGRFVQWCLDNDVPCPVSVLLLRPHQTYRMGTGVLLVPGGAAGHTFMGHLDFELGDDATRKMHFGHFTMYAKSIVQENRYVLWARNMYSGGYVGGTGHTFWQYTDNAADRCGRVAYQNAELNASLIACAVPMHYVPPTWHLDITGAYNTALYAPRLREPPHHPGAASYRAYWGWRNNASLAFTPHAPSQGADLPPTANTICFQGFQMVVDPRAGTLSRVKVNTGHWGQEVAIGAKAARNGDAATLPRPAYLGSMNMEFKM